MQYNDKCGGVLFSLVLQYNTVLLVATVIRIFQCRKNNFVNPMVPSHTYDN